MAFSKVKNGGGMNPKKKFDFKAFITKPKNIILILEGIFFAWFLFSFLLYPNLNLFGKTFFGGNFIENIKKIVGSQRAMKSIGNSFILAISMCVTVNVVGTLVVLITEYFKVHGAKILRIGYMSTMIYGGMILVSGYKYLYGEVGYFTKLLQLIFPSMNSTWFEGYGAVLFIMTFACTTNHVVFLRNALHQIDYQTIEAARNMGAGPMRILFKVVLPALLPSYLSITILTFIKGLCAMAAPLIVGGESFQTINPMIIAFINNEYTRPLGTVMTIFIGVVTIALLILLNWFERRGHYMSISKVKTRIVKQKIKNPVLNVLLHIIAYLLLIIYVAPIIMIVLFSFMDSVAIGSGVLDFSSFTFANYKMILTDVDAYQPLIYSVLMSAISVTLVITLVLFACRIITKYKKKRIARWLEYGLLIPWLLPALLISVGLLETYNSSQWTLFGISLGGSVVLLILGYVVNKIPYTLRMSKAAFYSIDDSLEEAAKNLGAGGMYTFVRVLLPIIVPTVLALWALEFNGTLGEYDISVLLSPTKWKTLGQTIKTLTTDSYDPNSTALSFVYSIIMMGVASIVVYFVYGRKGANHNAAKTKKMVKRLEKIKAQKAALAASSADKTAAVEVAGNE